MSRNDLLLGRQKSAFVGLDHILDPLNIADYANELSDVTKIYHHIFITKFLPNLLANNKWTKVLGRQFRISDLLMSNTLMSKQPLQTGLAHVVGILQSTDNAARHLKLKYKTLGATKYHKTI